MKRFYLRKTLYPVLAFLSVFLMIQYLTAQNVTLSTQAEVAAFGESDSTSINGSLLIDDLQSAEKVTDLSPLMDLISIAGDLRVLTSELSDLDGLDNLASIGGNLSVENNGGLQNINGLAELSAIPLDLFFRGNPALQNLDGLSGVLSVGGKLVLEDHTALDNIDGLSNITSFGGGRFLSRTMPLCATWTDLRI